MTHLNRNHILTIGCFFLTQLLVSCGGGGSSSGSSTDTNTSVPNVASFTATAGDTWVSLSWVNPTSNFSAVMVRRGTTCPANPSSGTLVSDAAGTSFVDAGLSNDTTYCYVAFAHDSSGHYSSGVSDSAKPVASYADIAAGGIHTLALKSDGTLWTWGADDWGQLGDGCTYASTCYNHYSPGQVGTDNTWSKVSAGTVHSVAIKSDGTLWSWGDNTSGQIGTGCADTSCFYYSTPTQTTTDTKWASISAGGFFTVAIKTDGTLWAWGDNNSAQLGDGCVPRSTCADKAIPTQIGTDTNWVAVAAGSNHVLALKANGTLWAWGNNSEGQIGNGLIGVDAYNTAPAQIGNDTDWKTVAAGDMHSLAIKTNGTLWSWGGDDWGQLGDSCASLPCTSKTTPTQVGSDTHWKDADGGFNLTIALKTDGTVWVWGNYATSTGTASSTPLQVGTGTAWSKVSAGGGGGYSGVGGGHFLSLESMVPNGSMLNSWGTNMQGALGLGTAYPVWTPSHVN